jgi:hypothetical protein
MELVERDAELGAVREALERARTGMGSLVVLEAPAGQGKTALLRASREQGKTLGMRVLSATGGSLSPGSSRSRRRSDAWPSWRRRGCATARSPRHSS